MQVEVIVHYDMALCCISNYLSYLDERILNDGFGSKVYKKQNKILLSCSVVNI